MRRLRIILIAHDDKKTDLVEWTRFNAGTLCRHDLIATAATGEVIQDNPGLTVRTLLHGPAGGDAQAGALIATGEADVATRCCGRPCGTRCFCAAGTDAASW